MNTVRTNQPGSRMILAMSIAVFVPNFAQYQLSPLAMGIMRDLHISPSQFSSLFTAPMIPAVALSLITGMLVDWINPKLVAGIAIAITVSGAILSVFTSSYSGLFIAFMLIGVSAAVLNSSQAKLISGWYAPQQVPARMGIILSASTLAMTLALATTALFPSRRAAFLASAMASVLALLFWLVLYQPPLKSEVRTRPASEPLIAGLRIVMGNRSVWVIALCLALIMGANVVMGSFTPVILTARGITQVGAGGYAALYMIGAVLSCYLAPAAAARLGRTRPVVVLSSFLGCAGVAGAAVYMPQGILLGGAILVTGICVGGSMPLLMALPVNLPDIGPRRAGTAGGFIATLQLVGAILIPSHILIPLAGEGQYARLFLLAGVCLLICSAVALLLPHDGPR